MVTRSRLNDFLRAQGREVQGTGDTGMLNVIEEQPDASQPDLWEREFRRTLFEWAVDRIRCDFEDTTWQAFWQTSVGSRETSDVAEELGLSVGAVYIARSRVLARLRKEIEEVDE
ncbi:MAG: DNA-directed RNA polymerase specialized sigma24 family protein [Planctomycetaceae bacterium]